MILKSFHVLSDIKFIFCATNVYKLVEVDSQLSIFSGKLGGNSSMSVSGFPKDVCLHPESIQILVLLHQKKNM